MQYTCLQPKDNTQVFIQQGTSAKETRRVSEQQFGCWILHPEVEEKPGQGAEWDEEGTH